MLNVRLGKNPPDGLGLRNMQNCDYFARPLPRPDLYGQEQDMTRKISENSYSFATKLSCPETRKKRNLYLIRAMPNLKRKNVFRF